MFSNFPSLATFPSLPLISVCGGCTVSTTCGAFDEPLVAVLPFDSTDVCFFLKSTNRRGLGDIDRFGSCDDVVAVKWCLSNVCGATRRENKHNITRMSIDSTHTDASQDACKFIAIYRHYNNVNLLASPQIGAKQNGTKKKQQYLFLSLRYISSWLYYCY